jgi:uncharacterized membrane protein YfcA
LGAIETYISVALVVLIASFLQGLVGFGFAMISVPVLTLVLGVKTAIALTVLCGMIIAFYMYYSLRLDFKFSNIRDLVIGALVGIPIGAIFLREADPKIIKTFLAVNLLAFSALSLLGKIKIHNLHDRWAYLFGMAAGICGGAVSINGPPVLIYGYIKNWDKKKFKASISAYFFVSAGVIAISHATLAITTYSIVLYFLGALPFLLVGSISGHRLFKKIRTDIFRRIIILLLIILAVILLISAWS